MTTTTVEIAPGAVSQKLRSQVRNRVEREYVRLRNIARPGVLGTLAADADGAGGAQARRALEILDYHEAAIRDHLETTHAPHPRSGVCPRCCVLLDQGEGRGPLWFLLAALPETNPRVIASDSALGRALVGARPGQTVYYPTPAGSRPVRLVALEPRTA